MNKPKDGYQSAMPYVLAPREDENGVMQRFEPGMTIRDYLAAHALIGILSRGEHDLSGSDYNQYSADAYLMADAMLRTRKTKET